VNQQQAGVERATGRDELEVQRQQNRAPNREDAEEAGFVTAAAANPR